MLGFVLFVSVWEARIMKGSGNYVGNHGKDKPAKKQGAVGSSYDAEFRGYINVNLSEEDKGRWEKFHGSPDVEAWFDSVVSDGVNVSTKVDAKSGGYISSATQRRADSVNAGLVVTARGATPSITFSRVMFILALLSVKEKWEDTQPLANPDRW